MKKIIITLILVFIYLVSPCQIVNNVSPDVSNIYFHALDTVIKVVRVKNRFQTINLLGEISVIQNFPDDVDGIQLIKIGKWSKKVPKIKKDEARVKISNIEIIRDQFKISILITGINGLIEDGFYRLRYQYIPETKSYTLRDIQKGFIL